MNEFKKAYTPDEVNAIIRKCEASLRAKEAREQVINPAVFTQVLECKRLLKELLYKPLEESELEIELTFDQAISCANLSVQVESLIISFKKDLFLEILSMADVFHCRATKDNNIHLELCFFDALMPIDTKLSLARGKGRHQRRDQD